MKKKSTNSLPVTVKNFYETDFSIILLDLPMDNASLDLLIENINMCGDTRQVMIDHIGNPLLERFEGQVVDLHTLNYLAKRMSRFTDDEIVKFKAIMDMCYAENIEEVIDLTYNLDIVRISDRCSSVCNFLMDDCYAGLTDDIKVKGLATVMDKLCTADTGKEFQTPYVMNTVSFGKNDERIQIHMPFREPCLSILKQNYDITEIEIEEISDTEECAFPLHGIKENVDLYQLNDLLWKITSNQFNGSKWLLYTEEYEINTLAQMNELCDCLDKLEYNDRILSEEDYAIDSLSQVYKGNRKDLDEILRQFDLTAVGKELNRFAATKCTPNGLISSREKVMKEGVHGIKYMPNSQEVERLKERYPKGTRIRLVEMRDSQAVEAGMTGTVETVDDAGSIHMKWDNGRGLALIPEEDSFEVLSRPEERQEDGMRML